MTTSPRVSGAQANHALRLVRQMFRKDLDADRWHKRTFKTSAVVGPQLRREYHPYWGGAAVPYAILWEDGPAEWVYDFLWGRAEGQPLIPGVFMEAGSSFVLCLYPEQQRGDPADCVKSHQHYPDGGTSDGLDCHPALDPEDGIEGWRWEAEEVRRAELAAGWDPNP